MRTYLCFEQVLNAQVRRVVLAGLVEGLQQQVALGGRQHIQLRNGHLRCVRQRVGQLLQRALHHGAQALRIRRLHTVYQQAQVTAVIVDRQAQRIVGALGAVEQAQARPLQLAVLVLVPVVEQAGEQRHTRGHATATLGQGQ